LSSASNDLNPIIFKDQFHFNITTKSVSDFINELHDVCQEEDLLKAIKTGIEKPIYDSLAIKTLVAEAEVKEAIESLENILVYYQPKSNQLLTNLQLFKNRFKELESNNMLGIITDYEIKKNAFTKDFLDFLDNEVEEQIGDIIL